MNDKEVSSVINACDAGREGELIFRLVYNQAKCNKPMERLWISSMEDSAIKDGFTNLKPGKDYDKLYEASESRACADWLVGMNMSRLYSIVNNQYYSVGRVQTPTLAMIYKREEEILNFQKEKYFTVDLICSRVSDHHAIIPTVSAIKKEALGMLDITNEDEIKVYKLVKNKLLASLDYPLVENTTKIISNNLGYDFAANGKVVIKEGFSKYLNYLKEYLSNHKEDNKLPNLKIGDVLDVINKEIKEKYTQPPNHYTEDTLLKSMEVAGVEAIDKSIEVERKGLGTPATRAGIIEALISKGFIKRVKKLLLITDKGKNLISIVDNTFKDPITTANWEMKLSNIAIGKETKSNFLKEIEFSLNNVINKYKFIRKDSG